MNEKEKKMCYEGEKNLKFIWQLQKTINPMFRGYRKKHV